ncbi:MAG: tetratricopeptide repeat protein [Hyphomicrobium sp.]|uniref:tetratricopeptide repeat protein n=1 Tax=Hyphomicrobium sp. TaxID=82 RepID=UPI003D0E2BB1
MTTFTTRFLAYLGASLLALASPALLSPALADGRVAKDTGPQGACDAYAKGEAAWRGCVGRAGAKMSDEELFYAGYWLAKSGQYAQALSYLSRAERKDERVLTYIGYATRKLGHVDEALPFYARALAVNANYVVARAYLGEALLSQGDLGGAQGELKEIAARCGVTCPAYVDLDTEIAAYEARGAKG